MKVYNKDKLVEINCNKCKKKIIVENDVIKEGIFSVDYRWGYFSQKDGIKHSFDLCEDCYDSFVSEFQISVDEGEYTEFV